MSPTEQGIASNTHSHLNKLWVKTLELLPRDKELTSTLPVLDTRSANSYILCLKNVHHSDLVYMFNMEQVCCNSGYMGSLGLPKAFGTSIAF